MWALRVISNYCVFIPTTQRELICTQQPGPKIMKLITSIKAMQLPKKGRNVIIHIETETSVCFPSRSVSLCVCLTIMLPFCLALSSFLMCNITHWCTKMEQELYFGFRKHPSQHVGDV